MVEWAVSVTDIIMAVASIMIAIFAGVSWYVTRQLAQDSRALRMAGTVPEVIAYLGVDGRRDSFVNIVLENIGQGPARDVEHRIDVDPAIFQNHSIDLVTPKSIRKVRSMLPQGQKVELHLGSSFALFKGKDQNKLQPFPIQVWYSNLRGEKRRTECFTLDISNFESELVSTPPEKEISRSLSRIEKGLTGLKSELQHFRVSVVDALTIYRSDK